MTSYYESATSGLNHDRFPTGSSSNINFSPFSDELFNESTLTKMKQHFWTAKQLFRSKLGKKEDSYLLASDAEFDAKLSKYFSIYNTTKKLLAATENYYFFTEELINCEKDFLDILYKELPNEKEHLHKVIKKTANCVGVASKQREKILPLIIRFNHELDIFNERAITDCQFTVEAAERARTEYRGSLLWIKSVSKELDPVSNTQMENFRKTQSVVRQNKEKFDALKTDTFYKVDILSQSRTTLLTEIARLFLDKIFEFYERVAETYNKVANELSNIDSYEIDILKILNDPVASVIERQKHLNNNKKLSNNFHLEESNKQFKKFEKQQMDTIENGEIEIELDDIEVGKIVTEAPKCKSKKLDLITKQNELLNNSLIQIENKNFDQNYNQLSSFNSDSLSIRAESPLGILDEIKENTNNLILNENYLFNLNINEFDLKNSINVNQASSLNQTKNNVVNVSSNNQSVSNSSIPSDINLNLPQCSNLLSNSFENNTKPIQNEILLFNLFKNSNENINQTTIANEFNNSASKTSNLELAPNLDTNSWINFLWQESDETLNLNKSKNLLM